MNDGSVCDERLVYEVPVVPDRRENEYYINPDAAPSRVLVVVCSASQNEPEPCVGVTLKPCAGGPLNPIGEYLG